MAALCTEIFWIYRENLEGIFWEEQFCTGDKGGEEKGLGFTPHRWGFQVMMLSPHTPPSGV